MSVQAHEGMDDMSDFSCSYLSRHVGVHRAQPLPADWPTRRAYIPQGCDQQGRVEPTIKSAEPFPVAPDRLPEEFDAEDQSDSADCVFWFYMAVIGAVIAAAVWAVLARV